MAFGDLTTLGEVKAWLQTGQAAFPDTDDVLLARLITAASQFIQKWLNRNIAAADWYEVRDGTGGQRLIFGNFPVTAVLSLSIDGMAIPPAPVTAGSAPDMSSARPSSRLRGYVFTRRPQNVEIIYTAGICSHSAGHRAGLHRSGLPALPRAHPDRRGVACHRRHRNRHLLAAGYERAREIAAVAIPAGDARLDVSPAAAPTATDPALVAAAL